MYTGAYDQYDWFEWQGMFLPDLLSHSPQLVAGRYLINTSFDSGPLDLSAEEVNRGWRKHKGLALSPPIVDVSDIPYDQYDEWYIFTTPATFDHYEVFVNYGGFSLHNPAFAEKQQRFWRQLTRLGPETYLADGDNLICVTRNAALIGQLMNWGSNKRGSEIPRHAG